MGKMMKLHKLVYKLISRYKPYTLHLCLAFGLNSEELMTVSIMF